MLDQVFIMIILAFAAVGKDDIMMRTFDGRVVETFLPSGCKIIGYLEKKELEGYNNYLTSDMILHFQWKSNSTHIKVLDITWHYKSNGEFWLPSSKNLE